MLTAEQIKLTGMCYFDRAALEEMHDRVGIRGQCGGHGSLNCLALYDAFLVIVGAVESYACSTAAFQAFKGFLAIELQQDSVQATSTLAGYLQFF